MNKKWECTIERFWKRIIRNCRRKEVASILPYSVLAEVLAVCYLICSNSLGKKYFFGYICIVLFVIILNLVNSRMYIYCKKKDLPWKNKLEVIGKLLCILLLVIGIFFILLILFAKIMVQYKEMDEETIVDFIDVFCSGLFVSLFLSFVNFKLCNLVIIVVNLCFRKVCLLNNDAIILFCILSLWFLEFRCSNKWIINKWKIKNSTINRTQGIKDNYVIRIKKWWEVEGYEKIDNAMKRILLLFLLVLFFIVTFVENVFDLNQSDVINVLTIYTLIMLFLDKRKEWKIREK